MPRLEPVRRSPVSPIGFRAGSAGGGTATGSVRNPRDPAGPVNSTASPVAESRRVGILGGSFDPLHYGHLLLADTAREHLNLDRVLLVPAAVSPLKPSGPVASAKERVDMLRLATSGTHWLEISTVEVDRGATSYTVDTLRQLVGENPGDQFYLILGSDQVASLHEWHEPTEIFQLVRPAVVDRPGCALPSDDYLRRAGVAAVIAAIERDGLIPMPPVDLSSTELRQRIAASKSIRFRMPRAVEQYIAEHGLYKPTAS